MHSLSLAPCSSNLVWLDLNERCVSGIAPSWFLLPYSLSYLIISKVVLVSHFLGALPYQAPNLLCCLPTIALLVILFLHIFLHPSIHHSSTFSAIALLLLTRQEFSSHQVHWSVEVSLCLPRSFLFVAYYLYWWV